jgi:agmatine/peptidylarginine deiminase
MAFIIDFMGSVPPAPAAIILAQFHITNGYFIYDFFGSMQDKSGNNVHSNAAAPSGRTINCAQSLAGSGSLRCLSAKERA